MPLFMAFNSALVAKRDLIYLTRWDQDRNITVGNRGHVSTINTSHSKLDLISRMEEVEVHVQKVK